MKNNVEQILKNNQANYKWYNHEPIYCLDDALRIDEQFNIEGIETKNLFLKSSDGCYYVYLTTTNNRFDRKKIKDLINKKLSIVNSNELTSITGYVAGSVPQFPFDNSIIYLCDREIFNYNSLICSGGTPTTSFTISGEELKKIIDNTKNQKIYI